MAGRRNISVVGGSNAAVAASTSTGTPANNLMNSTSSAACRTALDETVGLMSTSAATATTIENETVTSRSRHRRNRSTLANFNPKLIFSQIVAIQCFHYLILGLMFQFNHFLFATSITMDRIFTDTFLNVWTWVGWIDGSTILLSYLFGAVLLAIIVEKSKKCLDFSVTLFLIHLISCIWYAGIPGKLDWWIVHVLGTIVMILFGEYLCSLKELSDIPLLEL